MSYNTRRIFIIDVNIEKQIMFGCTQRFEYVIMTEKWIQENHKRERVREKHQPIAFRHPPFMHNTVLGAK